jgi:hypothetical protein
MKKKNCHEINLIRGKVRKGKFTVYKTGMPTIRCVCGMRILVVPDLKAMNRAIKNHEAKHKQADYGLVPDSMKAFLTKQILIGAGKMNLPAIYNF